MAADPVSKEAREVGPIAKEKCTVRNGPKGRQVTRAWEAKVWGGVIGRQVRGLWSSPADRELQNTAS